MAQEENKRTTDFIESPEIIQEQIDKTSQFAQSNKEMIVGVLVAILIIVAGAFWYKFNQEEEEKEAQLELFPAVFYLEKDSTEKAIQGDGGNMTIGLEAITDDYSGTKAANLSKIYLGMNKLKNGKFDEAIDLFEDFSADDYLLQSRVYSLIADAYMEKEDYGSAIENYKKAVSRYENTEFTPIYLRKLALAQEIKGDKTGAIASYQKIIDDFEKSKQRNYARKMITKLGTK